MAKKCKDCVRFGKTKVCMTLSCREKIQAEDKGCKFYWDREEQERSDREYEEMQELKRQELWKKNKDNPPVKLPIVFDGYGMISECPNCHDMPYSTEQCHWCGQRFIQDEELEEYTKPKTTTMNCFNCGAEVTVHISNYNGHKRYRRCGDRRD